MILKNYWKWLHGVTYCVTTTQQTFNVGLYDMNGDNVTIILGGRNNDNANKNISWLYDMFVRLGTSETDTSESDYALNNDVTSSLSNLNFNIQSQGDENLRRTITITGANNTENAITLRQVAIGKTIYGESYTPYEVLFAIVNLNEAITVGSGDSFTIALEWIED